MFPITHNSLKANLERNTNKIQREMKKPDKAYKRMIKPKNLYRPTQRNKQCFGRIISLP